MIDPRTVPHYGTPEQIEEIGARHAADAKRRGLSPLEAFVARWESPFDGDDLAGLIEEVAVAAVAVSPPARTRDADLPAVGSFG